MPTRRLLALLVAASSLSLGACDATDSTAPETPQGPSYDSLTVDASAAWAFVGFSGQGAAPVGVAAPASSEAWDVAFFATSVMLNGGAAGPAGVVGHCLCRNADVSDEALMAMTPESELDAFQAVTLADVPADEDAWQSDALAPAIDGWYAYDFTTHTVSAAPENVWAVRTASGDAFAKLHVTRIEGAGRSHAGTVTFRYALQPAAGAPFQEARTVTVDLSAGPVWFDLESGATVPAGTEGWDLWLEGYDIRVNGGVSGNASAGALALDESFEAVADASGAPARVYAGDAFGGVFDAHPWYRYNLQGGHQVWPTYDVYLVKRGEAVYKVQLTSYYGPTGDTRRITFRYDLLS